MDKNTQIQPQNSPENSSNLLLKTQKNTTKKPWKFYIFPVIVLIISIWYGGYFRLFATGSPMAPNTVTDPTCAPGTPNCFVQVYPTATTSNSGKILSSDGSATIWIDQNGGVFSYAGQPITRAFGNISTTTALGTATTTLSDFIKNIFFPAPAITYQAYTASTTLTLSGGASTTIETFPTITAFAVATSSSLTPTGCIQSTTLGVTSLTGCDQISSSNNNVNLSWTVSGGTRKIVNNFINHKIYTLKVLSNGTWDGVSTVTSTLPCSPSPCSSYSTSTDQDLATSFPTNSGGNTTSTSTFSGPTTVANISSIQIYATPGASGATFCGITPPTSFSSGTTIANCSPSPLTISGISDVRSSIPATVAYVSGSGTTTTFGIQAMSTTANSGSVNSASATVNFALKTYWFVSNYDYHTNGSGKTNNQMFSDFNSLTTTGGSGNCLASFCGNTGVSSTDTSGTRQRTIRMFVSNQYVFYAYPTSAGGITNYNLGAGAFKVDGANDSSLTQDIITLQNSVGVNSTYYLYGYQGTDGAPLSLLSTAGGATSTAFTYGP